MTDPTDISWLRVIFAFSVVLALMASLGGVLKYLNSRGFTFQPKSFSKTHRLKIVENLPIDARRRCVIVRCDDHEHLLLLGAQNDIVIEANLPPTKQ